MKTLPLEALYARLATIDRVTPDSLLPPGIQQEVGHFNVFSVAELMRSAPNKPPATFNRQAFYKITLLQGHSRVEYADQAVDIAHQAVWFASHRLPCRWLPQDSTQTGYYCVFTEEFLLPARSRTALLELPIFQPGSCPVWEVSPTDFAALETIFQQMIQEIQYEYVYKYDLLRAYLVALIHRGQQLQPTSVLVPPHCAAARLAGRFADLLERQFPVDTQQQLLLHTATEYATELSVHVNHLNRVLKEITGHTTTALVGARVAQEAKLLLKHTQWSVSEIAYSLGFANVGHFCTFFKRQTTMTPGNFRT